MKFRAARLRQIMHRLGKLMHPALNPPNTTRLRLPDQREQAGALIGRAADISRIPPKKLSQARVAELLCKRARERFSRSHQPRQIWAGHDMAHQSRKGRAGRHHHRLFKPVKQRARL